MPLRLFHLGNQMLLLELILVKWMGKTEFCHEHFLLALYPLPARVLLVYWFPSFFKMFWRSLPAYDAGHIFFLFPHTEKSQLFGQCQWNGICFRVHSVTYHLLRRNFLFFSRETSSRAQSCEGCGCGIFGVGVSSSSWCSYFSLVLKEWEGQGNGFLSGTKKAHCSPLILAEASWPAQTSRNFFPSSSSVTCCLRKASCAHMWQRGRGREGRGARLGWVGSALCCAVQERPRLPCPTLRESIQTSWAWGPLNVWLYCFNNNLSRSKSYEFDECSWEIWNMI